MITFTPDQQELLVHLRTTNKPTYNFNKATEECVEFMEVLIKLQTKGKANPKRPDKIESIKEYGDVIYRGLVALMTLYPDASPENLLGYVNAHIHEKLSKLQGYKELGSYDGGL